MNAQLKHSSGEFYLVAETTGELLARQYYPVGDTECLEVARTRVLEEAQKLKLRVVDQTTGTVNDFASTLTATLPN